jgi:cob(I)alamin adenosyltransferase
MKYRDAKRMRDCVKYLEAIVKQRGKIDSTYIDKADEFLKQLEKAGSAAISEARGLIDQAERSLWEARRRGSRYFRQEYVNRAQQKLMEVSRDYPVQSLAKRLTDAQTRLSQITAEYQRIVQEEQKEQDK